MNSQLAPRSGHVASSLGKAEVYEVQEVAQRSAMVTEITKVANFEVARVGAHAVGTMADLVQGAGNVHRQLLDSGHRSDIYVDAQIKMLQVTGQNIITLANTAQQEILRQAASHMR
jgi:hypothetical protein